MEVHQLSLLIGLVFDFELFIKRLQKIFITKRQSSACLLPVVRSLNYPPFRYKDYLLLYGMFRIRKKGELFIERGEIIPKLFRFIRKKLLSFEYDKGSGC
ncbi:hypothetical protein QJ48_26155 [Paenibacillus sp. A3]|nr:hypothetical protein QJ48_26155 [Paenibacillus sp. A3]